MRRNVRVALQQKKMAFLDACPSGIHKESEVLNAVNNYFA